MTAKLRKRDLRTRVTEPTYRAVERYAVAHALTPYAATERLLMLGVNALSHGDEAAARLQSSLDSLDGRLTELTRTIGVRFTSWSPITPKARIVAGLVVCWGGGARLLMRGDDRR